MNKVIEITIRNKVARIASSPIIVGKNKDYIVRFDFDEDWDKYDTKTARFSQDGEYQDIIFAGNECSMPALDGGKVVEVGVYAGDISTTTPAYLKVQKSIIDDDGVPADPQPDVYAQLMERLNDLEAPAAVLYTEQNLTDEQKAQARDNIGVTESLGMTGATVGQVPAVKAVDGNGAPTEWEAVELPGGAYTVNLTMDNGGNITADKTFAEIKAAHDDGKVVNAKFADAIVPLSSLTDLDALFIATNANSSEVYTASLICTSANVWSMSQNGFDAHTLGISGASVGQIVKIKTVDSSGVPTEWEPADMPSGGGGTDTSLGLAGATVGQTVKIKSVDENGVPTEWEAADDALPLLYHGKGSEEISGLEITEIDGNPMSLSEVKVRAIFKVSTATWCGIELCTSAKNPNNQLITAEGGSVFTTAEKYYLATAHGKISNGNFEINAVQPTQFTPYLNISSGIKNVASINTIPNFVYNDPPVLQEMNAENGQINKVKIYGNFSEVEVIIWGR